MRLLHLANRVEGYIQSLALQQPPDIKQSQLAGLWPETRPGQGQPMFGVSHRQLDGGFVAPAPANQRQSVACHQDSLGLPEGAAHQRIQRYEEVGDVAQALMPTLAGRESRAQVWGNRFAAGDRAEVKGI